MEMMKVQQMIEACRAAVLGSGVGEIDNIVRDSREVKAGSLFVAIVGENMDGHKFIPKAWELGAEAVLAQPRFENTVLTDSPCDCTDPLIAAHPDTDWRTCVEHAEKLGIGQRAYELVKI